MIELKKKEYYALSGSGEFIISFFGRNKFNQNIHSPYKKCTYYAILRGSNNSVIETSNKSNICPINSVCGHYMFLYIVFYILRKLL